MATVIPAQGSRSPQLSLSFAPAPLLSPRRPPSFIHVQPLTPTQDDNLSEEMSGTDARTSTANELGSPPSAFPTPRRRGTLLHRVSQEFRRRSLEGVSPPSVRYLHPSDATRSITALVISPPTSPRNSTYSAASNQARRTWRLSRASTVEEEPESSDAWGTPPRRPQRRFPPSTRSTQAIYNRSMMRESLGSSVVEPSVVETSTSVAGASVFDTEASDADIGEHGRRMKRHPRPKRNRQAQPTTRSSWGGRLSRLLTREDFIMAALERRRRRDYTTGPRHSMEGPPPSIQQAQEEEEAGSSSLVNLMRKVWNMPWIADPIVSTLVVTRTGDEFPESWFKPKYMDADELAEEGLAGIPRGGPTASIMGGPETSVHAPEPAYVGIWRAGVKRVFGR